MNELLVIDQTGVAVLDEKTAEQIAEFKRKVKAIEDAEKELEAAILKEMQEKNVFRIETPALIINLIEATTRETFDSKALRKDFPEIYDSFVKLTPVKASVRVKLR